MRSEAIGSTLSLKFLTVAISLFTALPAFAVDPVANKDIQARVENRKPAKEKYIKDAPTLVLPFVGTKLSDTPEAVLAHLGGIDQTKYNDKYFEKNQGSAFALQMKDATTPDFYPIGLDTFQEKYKIVPLEEAATKNKKVYGQVIAVPGLKELAEQGLIKAALKAAPVEMVRMSSIGYKTDYSITIESPWGEQTKPAGQDAWLVWDSGKNMYYMVNSDDSGLPLSYIPVELKIDRSESLANQLRMAFGEEPIENDHSLLQPSEVREALLQSRVQDNYNEFFRKIYETLDGRPATLHEIVGFSGADYYDKANFKNKLSEIVVKAIVETKATYGEKALTVFMLGGTYDGFGVLYEVIQGKIADGTIRREDILVKGMVSDQAVPYHIDGISNPVREKRYNTIAPTQDTVLVLPTYKEGENQTWELKETPFSKSKTVDILFAGPFKKSVLHVLEGGDQALKEVMELILTAHTQPQINQAEAPEIRLYVGYREGKLSKIKGYKAATQLVSSLNQFPMLKPRNLDLSITLEGFSLTMNSVETMHDYLTSYHYEQNPNFIESVSIMAKVPENETAERTEKFQTAMRKTSEMWIEQINKAISRMEMRIGTIDGWFNTTLHPINDSPSAAEHYLEEQRILNDGIRKFKDLRSTLEQSNTANASAENCEGTLLPPKSL